MPTTRATLTDSAWTNLGAAPLTLQVERGRVHLVVDTAAPSTTGIEAIPAFVVGRAAPEKSFDAGYVGQNVYARSQTGTTASVVVVV
jgi:hypothetical protein